jgi:hypothetical protein
MPDTGERREITHFVNAKEAELVQESKKLISKTKQRSAKAALETRSRKGRTISPGNEEKPHETEALRHDQEGSDRMVDEGDPN